MKGETPRFAPSLQRKIVVESPYRSTERYTLLQNVEFAKEVCRWAIRHGYSPIASHLFYTQLLDDTKEYERNLGMSLGLQWGALADEAWFCLRPDEDLSEGMLMAEEFYGYIGHLLRYFRFDPDGNFLREERI